MQSHSDSVIAPPRFPLFNHSADNFLLSLKPTVVVVAHDVDEVEVFVHLRHVVGSERGCWGCTWMPIKDVLRMFLPLLRLSIGSDQEVLLLLCGWGRDEEGALLAGLKIGKHFLSFDFWGIPRLGFHGFSRLELCRTLSAFQLSKRTSSFHLPDHKAQV